MPQDGANPWLFRRDELDLLEDELDDLFHWHEHSRSAVEKEMEEEVIVEQERTEKTYENRLTDVLGPDSMSPGEEHVCEHCRGGFPEGVPLREMLVGERDPLYARAYAWSVAVFGWARESYRHYGMRNRDMFRVYLNAYLVPVKIAFALAEEGRDDERAPLLAAMEYELALTYLGRTRESLGALRAMGLVHPDLVWMINEADQVAALLTKRLKRLDSKGL
jgi:hypothetical protein